MRLAPHPGARWNQMKAYILTGVQSGRPSEERNEKRDQSSDAGALCHDTIAKES